MNAPDNAIEDMTPPSAVADTLAQSAPIII